MADFFCAGTVKVGNPYIGATTSKCDLSVCLRRECTKRQTEENGECGCSHAGATPAIETNITCADKEDAFHGSHGASERHPT